MTKPAARSITLLLASMMLCVTCAFQPSKPVEVRARHVASKSNPTSFPTLSSKPSSSTTITSSQLALSDTTNPAIIRPKKKNLKTFQRYLEIECWKRAELRDLERVLQAVAESCKQINRIVQRAQTDDLYGAAVDKDGSQLEANIQGEVQQQLDVLCNTIMLRAFCGSSKSIHSVASEEEDEPRCCSDVMVCNTFYMCPKGGLSRSSLNSCLLYVASIGRVIQLLRLVISLLFLTPLMVPRILMHLYPSEIYLESTRNNLALPSILLRFFKTVVPW